MRGSIHRAAWLGLLVLSGCQGELPAWCAEGTPIEACPACDPARVGEPCYAGPPGTAGVGRCGAGLRTCIEETGHLICEGQILPGIEDPATPAVDDDCDGRLDEGASIACGDCGSEVSISLVRLAERGPRHRVAVRLVRPQMQPGDQVARRTESALRARALDEMLVERGLPPLEDIRPLAASGFTATATVAALEALVDDLQVAGIVADYALGPQLVESAALIGAPAARRRSALDGRGVRVAVIDSGVDYRHPAFGACLAPGAPDCRIVEGWSVVDGDRDVMDRVGHGTHMASIIAGGRGGPAPTGVAPGAELVVIRAAGADGMSVTHLLDALDNLIARPDLGLRVVVVGFGSEQTYSALACGEHDRQHAGDLQPGLVRGLVGLLEAAGVFVVFPSGNSGDAYEMSYPACLSGLNAVGAVYDADRDAPSTYALPGPDGQPPVVCTDPAPEVDDVPCFSNGEPHDLDLVAPGASIDAAGLDGGVRGVSGTSAAAAHVGGAAALLFAEDPGRGPADVGAELRRVATLVRERRPHPTRQEHLNGYPAFRLSLSPLIDRACRDGDDDGVGGAGPDCAGAPDCRDDDPTVHPGAAERCDGRDDDCDGVADEGFDIGERCVAGRGACEAVGVRVCDAGGGAGCDAMLGAPQPELCNGLDDDCDGRVDEAIPPRTVTFFRTGEACCDTFENDGVSAGEPPRYGPWFDVAEREIVEVRVRHASDGQAGCAPCADCPEDCSPHEEALCDDPEPQGNERLRVSLLAADGSDRHLGDTEDLNGGGGGDWRAPEQQCRQRDQRFPSVEPGPGRYRVRVQHVADDGPSNSTKLQTSRATIRCGP